MPYVIFALKWRPQNFDEIIGQNHIVKSLKESVARKRLANAYLFAGPRGVGKTSMARILAKALNCQSGPTANPCGKCVSCLEISGGRSFDVMEIDGASNRGIDEIRTLRENVKFAPAGSKYKVYIIDEVHMLTTEAFNALLKTLEEPPEFVKFIFATTQPGKVIPTILSRCQRFDFRRISNNEIISQLEKIALKEGIAVDKEVLSAVAKSSDGSLRDAESVFDQLASFSRDKVSLSDAVSLLGLVDEDILFTITESIIQKDTQKALELLNKVSESGKDLSVFLNRLIEHFRNLMIAKVTSADPSLVDLPEEACRKLLKQSAAFSLEEIFAVFNVLTGAQEASRRMDSLSIPLEISLVKLTQGRKEAAPKIMPCAASVMQQAKEDPVLEKDTAGEDEAPLGQAGLEEVKNNWESVISALGKLKMSVATYMNEATPLKLHNNLLTVSFPKNCSLHKDSLERKENKDIIEKVLSQRLKAQIRVNFTLSQEENIEQPEQENSFIRAAMEVFKGRVIKEG